MALFPIKYLYKICIQKYEFNNFKIYSDCLREDAWQNPRAAYIAFESELHRTAPQDQRVLRRMLVIVFPHAGDAKPQLFVEL